MDYTKTAWGLMLRQYFMFFTLAALIAFGFATVELRYQELYALVELAAKDNTIVCKYEFPQVELHD